jgi:hypothetical protein
VVQAAAQHQDKGLQAALVRLVAAMVLAAVERRL